MEYTSPLTRFDLTMLGVIGTDCIIQLSYDDDHDAPLEVYIYLSKP